MATDQTACFIRERLRKRFAADSDGILEAIADEEGIPLLDVVHCLPHECWSEVSGRHFTAAMEHLSKWGIVTLIVHTPDVIFEFTGVVPQGRLGLGFFNLHGKEGFGGHLRPERCASIVFLRRPFMGMETASVQFFNPQGSCMFKVFVGRDQQRQLCAEQLIQFEQLKKTLLNLEEAP